MTCPPRTNAAGRVGPVQVQLRSCRVDLRRQEQRLLLQLRRFLHHHLRPARHHPALSARPQFPVCPAPLSGTQSRNRGPHCDSSEAEGPNRGPAGPMAHFLIAADPFRKSCRRAEGISRGVRARWARGRGKDSGGDGTPAGCHSPASVGAATRAMTSARTDAYGVVCELTGQVGVELDDG